MEEILNEVCAREGVILEEMQRQAVLKAHDSLGSGIIHGDVNNPAYLVGKLGASHKAIPVGDTILTQRIEHCLFQTLLTIWGISIGQGECYR